MVVSLVLFEGAGVARALAAAGESIECCCGRHDAHRACKCKACPVSRRRAHAATTRVDAARSCDGSDEPGALVVTALPRSKAPSLLPLVAVERLVWRVTSLGDRAVDVGRPPP
jgi:hypothetical protein